MNSIKPSPFITPLILTTLLSCASCKTMAQVEAPEPKSKIILLTVFEPFGGRKENFSAEVAKRIETELRQKSPDSGPAPDIKICLLPVEYNRGAQVAEKCIARLSQTPDLILSLGEGGCEIRVETATNNLDDAPGFPDNKNQVRENIPILKNAPARIGLRLPFEKLYCHMKHARAPEDSDIIGSITPGNFVCNNTAFLLAHAPQLNSIPYGFIHVPHGGCQPEIKNPIRNAEIISAGLRAILNSTDALVTVYDKVNDKSEAFPTNLEGLLHFKAQTITSESTCAGDFYWQLESAYRSRLKKSLNSDPASGVSK